MKLNCSRLPGGPVVATAEMPHMESACIGVWALVGSRHEPARLNGIAHFAEHLLFKGTRRRKAIDILREVEGVGGSMNAFTEVDHTCYYAKAEARHIGRLADVLFDMLRRSLFESREIAREREVIEEEIVMYREQPSQHVEDLLSEAAWPGCALGRLVTGTPESLRRIDRPALKDFVRRWYGRRNTLVTVAGRVGHDDIVRQVGELAAGMPEGRRASASAGGTGRPGGTRPILVLESREIEQAHLCVGFLTPGRRSESRFALRLLNVILGENMSSRLFQELRERRGLCYSVQSDLTQVHETGLFSVYAGVDPEMLPEALAVTMRELRRIARRPPMRRELREAVEYAVGMSRLSRESTTQQMLWMGESLVAHGRVLDPDELCARVATVTPDEIARAAAAIFRPGFARMAVIGPEAGAMADRFERAIRQGLAP